MCSNTVTRNWISGSFRRSNFDNKSPRIQLNSTLTQLSISVWHSQSSMRMRLNKRQRKITREHGKQRAVLTMWWKEKTGTSIPRDLINRLSTTWRCPITSKPWKPKRECKALHSCPVKMASQISNQRWKPNAQRSPRRNTSTPFSSLETTWWRSWPRWNRRRSMTSIRRWSLPTSTSRSTPWRRRRLSS